MGADDDSRPSRRTVLKATGVTLGTGLVATGTAAAECYEGDKATLLYDYKLLRDGGYNDCVGDAIGPEVEKGTEYEVYDVCTENSASYIKVYSRRALEYRRIDEEAVECS
jgi:hypothetical protein